MSSSLDAWELLKAKAKRLQNKLDIKDRKYHLKTYKQWYASKTKQTSIDIDRNNTTRNFNYNPL